MNIVKSGYKYLVFGVKVVSLKRKEINLYKYVMCKQCKNCIRLPKNKGNIVVTCPECKQTFEKET